MDLESQKQEIANFIESQVTLRTLDINVESRASTREYCKTINGLRFVILNKPTLHLVLSKNPINLRINDLDKTTIDCFQKWSRLRVNVKDYDNELLREYYSIDDFVSSFLKCILDLGDENLFKKYHYKLRDMVGAHITNLENFDAWKNFTVKPILDSDGNRRKLPLCHPIWNTKQVRKANKNMNTNIYNVNNHGREFISIDFKEANYNMLKLHGLVQEENYVEFISKFTNFKYFFMAKKLRMLVIGNPDLLPNKQHELWEYHMCRILYKLLDDKLLDTERFAAFNSDEVVFHLDEPDKLDLSLLYDCIETEFPQLFPFVKIEKFKLLAIPIDSKHFYVKEYPNGKKSIKCIDSSRHLEALARIVQ